MEGGKKKTQPSEQNPSLKDTAVLERDGKTKRKREVRSRRLQGWNRYADLWIQRGKDRLGRTERNSDIYIYIPYMCKIQSTTGKLLDNIRSSSRCSAMI